MRVQASRAGSTTKALPDVNFLDTLDAKVQEQYARITKDTKRKEGVVYTPEYICQFIIANTIKIDERIYRKKILDPCVGGGIFVVELLKYLHHHQVDVQQILPNITCLDINPQRVAETQANLQDFCTNYFGITCTPAIKVKQADFLELAAKKFDYIIGNPPYINSHNLPKSVKAKLKANFVTTRHGNANIAYAFIEKSIGLLRNSNAKVGFIIPNNFLHIRSALQLRQYLASEHLVEKLVDFGYNLPFAPLQTYNAIVILNRHQRATLSFSNLSKRMDLPHALASVKYQTISYVDLKPQGWHLVNNHNSATIKKYETRPTKLGDYIRTGIATLRDKLYILADVPGDYLEKEHAGKLYLIEKAITRYFYKVSDIKKGTDISNYRKRIIYPYKQVGTKTVLLPETELKRNFPLAYKYLVACKEELLQRDAHKIPATQWYRYGRSQGLGNSNYKVLYKTFNAKPEFYQPAEIDCLFANGYCIEAATKAQLQYFLQRLDLEELDFYVKNTSYAIDGGYYCYQKKYLENFSF